MLRVTLLGLRPRLIWGRTFGATPGPSTQADMGTHLRRFNYTGLWPVECSASRSWAFDPGWYGDALSALHLGLRPRLIWGRTFGASITRAFGPWNAPHHAPGPST